jgi:mutual gliding-motility protein MglA
MAFVNHVTKNIAIKVVYYGPGLSGKTTNLRYIYYKLDPANRGELVCLETDEERTYFFDMLPIRAGMIGEFKVHFQLLTVPGQVFYEASRKSVLRGADGIVFVADSQIPLLDANLENFDGLRRNCLEHSIDLDEIPLVFQYNKRDLQYILPVETFNNLLNPRGRPYIEAIAIKGTGVFETLREIAKLTVPAAREKILGDSRKGEAGPEEPPVTDLPALQESQPAAAQAKSGAQVGPFPDTARIRLKSKKNIEEELERLSREFADKEK